MPQKVIKYAQEPVVFHHHKKRNFFHKITGQIEEDEKNKLQNLKSQQLIDENKRTQTENNSLKVVNEKLNDRIDFLQSIIEKEASANTYYYNYPPKADESLK